MSLPELTGNELLAWVERTSQGWQRLVAAHPEALQFPCDIRETNTVGELLQHIVAVELRYAERLNGLAETPYEQIPYDSSDSIYQTHRRATALYRQLEDRDHAFWDERIEFQTRKAGTLTVTRQVVYVHALMHSIRHYAQLATIVRKQGVAPDWGMDYLLMGV